MSAALKVPKNIVASIILKWKKFGLFLKLTEWEKLPRYRCAKLVVSYPRTLKAVIAAKGASTKY
jgi:hypothetical protein